MTGCSLQQWLNTKENWQETQIKTTNEITKNKKIFKPAEAIDPNNTKIVFENIWKLSTEKSYAKALNMENYLSKTKNTSKMCSMSCWGNYWFEHAIQEKPGKECERYRLMIPEYWIKLFSRSINHNNIQKKNFLNGESIELDPIGKGNSYTPSLLIFRIPKGQTFEETIQATRPEIKKEEITKYLPKKFKLDNQITEKYTGATKNRYRGFWNNINTMNKEMFTILKISHDDLLIYIKTQPNIFFIRTDHFFKPQTPTCPDYLFDTI